MDPSTQQFLAAAARAADWIGARQNSDGSFCNAGDSISGYYKVPFALSLAGRQRQALQLADWIAEHHFSPAGDFGPPGHRGSDHERWPTYQNAWLVQGLHRLERWDLSLQGARFLLEYQVPLGGFYAREGETRIVEPVCTSWSGLAALTTGYLAAARKAGDALARMVNLQPEPGRFYFRMDADGNLITDSPEDGCLFSYVDADVPGQIYYNPGIALIFLCHLHRATGQESYLRAAQTLFDFAESCAADVYAFPPSGKLGLGCALLFELTGCPAARGAALRVGEYLVETQTPEGIWRLPEVEPYAAPKYRGGRDIDLDIAAEFSVFLSEIAWRV